MSASASHSISAIALAEEVAAKPEFRVAVKVELDDSSSLALSGAVAGGVEALVVQPFDLIKTRFQLNTGANPSMLTAFRQVCGEGGIRQLYRGLLPELAGNIPTRTAMYASKDVATNILVSHFGEKSIATEFVAGGLSGIPEAIVTTPFQVVKVRLQNKANNALYRNSFDCFARIIRTEGLNAVMKGVVTTSQRNAVWNSVYFGFMHMVRTQTGGQRDGLAGKFQNLAIGFVGGVGATCCNAPLDVAKSRIQGAAGFTPKYTGTFSTLLTVFREEGPKSLYKGFAPKALRMGLGGAVGITAFETVRSLTRP